MINSLRIELLQIIKVNMVFISKLIHLYMSEECIHKIVVTIQFVLLQL